MKKFVLLFALLGSLFLGISCSDDKNTIQGIWKNSFTTETEFFFRK